MHQTKTIMKQDSSPKRTHKSLMRGPVLSPLFCCRDDTYLIAISKQTTTAKKATPSTKAAAIIMLERRKELDSG